jgi:hypothetical protein
MVRRVRVAVLCALLLGAGYSARYVHTYDGLNKGVTVGSYGLEVVGHPGIFHCEGQC